MGRTSPYGSPQRAGNFPRARRSQLNTLIGADLVLIDGKSNIMDWNDQIKGLNDLYELLVDSQKGYHEAAESVEHVQLADFLNRLGKQRITMEEELGAEIRKFRPDDRMYDGTFKGIFHRTWMDIRKALGSSDDSNMLNECERGEKYLVEQYDTLLSDPDIMASSKQLLAIQRGQVQENLAMVKTLRKVSEAVEK